MRALMIVLILFATPSFAGPNISYQTEYTPRPDIAAEVLNCLTSNLPLVGYVASAISGHVTAAYGTAAPYRELPKLAVPGKIAH